MTPLQRTILEPNVAMLHPDEIRRYRHFRATFAAELYLQIGYHRSGGASWEQCILRALTDLATDRNMVNPPPPSDFFPNAPKHTDPSDA